MNSNKEKSKDKEKSTSQTTLDIRESFMEIMSMDMEFMFGVMVSVMKVNGKTTKCMGMVLLLGVMVNITKVRFLKAEDMDMGSRSGQMVKFTRGNGKWINSMIIANLLMKMETNKVKNIIIKN